MYLDLRMIIFIISLLMIIALGCKVEWDEFDSSESFPIQIIQNVSESAVFKSINFLRIYQQQHSIDAIKQESQDQLCRRTFVIKTFWPLKCNDFKKGVGSNFAQVLNHIAMAVILNKTFILKDDDQLEEDCLKYISIRKWIPSNALISQQLQEAGCLGTFGNPIELTTFSHRIDYSIETSKSLTLVGFAPTELYCLREESFGWKLDGKYRSRAKLLFGSTRPSLAGDLGRLEGFGVLFRFIIEFSNYTKEMATPILGNIYDLRSKKTICPRLTNVISVGAHLRHQTQGFNDNAKIFSDFDDAIFLQIMILKKRFPKLQCIIVISTDREESITNSLNFGNKNGCKIYYIYKEQSHTKDFNVEHGIWAGSQVFLDLYVISHVSFFIGTGASTLSLLMSDLVGARNAISGYYDRMSIRLFTPSNTKSQLAECRNNLLIENS